MTLSLTAVPGIPFIKAGDNLGEIIVDAMARAEIAFAEGDILVLAQKIVSKSEGRLIRLRDVIPTSRAESLAEETQKDPRFIELVLRESSAVLRTRPGTIVVEHKRGFICANAGIDHSNVAGPDGEGEDWCLLLPDDADASAQVLRDTVRRLTGVSIGVLIIDSHGRAWRLGTVGVAIGLAGLPGLVDLRGTQDLFGYTLKVTMVAAADELAAGASLIMGQAAEGTPVIHVRGFPYALRESTLGELIRPREMDLFR